MVLGSDSAGTFVQWASKSLPTVGGGRTPKLLGALTYAVKTLSASDNRKCLYSLEQQQDTLRQLHRLLLEPLVTPGGSDTEALLSLDARHLIFVPDKVSMLPSLPSLTGGRTCGYQFHLYTCIPMHPL